MQMYKQYNALNINQKINTKSNIVNGTTPGYFLCLYKLPFLIKQQNTKINTKFYTAC